MNITNEQLEEIGARVFEEAEKIFEKIAPNDFAYQGGLTFGSVNRITLTSFGWMPSVSHCNPEFVIRLLNYMDEKSKLSEPVVHR